jgi:hypothetical protein
MVRVWMYAMNPNKNRAPDNVRCVVPGGWMTASSSSGRARPGCGSTSGNFICAQDRTYRVLHSGLYIVAVNGSNPECIRKVVASGGFPTR